MHTPQHACTHFTVAGCRDKNNKGLAGLINGLRQSLAPPKNVDFAEASDRPRSKHSRSPSRANSPSLSPSLSPSSSRHRTSRSGRHLSPSGRSSASVSGSIAPSSSRSRQPSVNLRPDASCFEPTGQVKYDWKIAKGYVLMRTQAASTFSISEIPFHAWPITPISTMAEYDRTSRSKVSVSDPAFPLSA